MGKYNGRLLLPPNTPETVPLETTIIIAESMLTGYEIVFPPGCAALAGIALFCEGVPFAPATGSGDKWFRGEGPITWASPDGIRLVAGKTPIKITVRGYNDDDTYPHTPIIRLDTRDGT